MEIRIGNKTPKVNPSQNQGLFQSKPINQSRKPKPLERRKLIVVSDKSVDKIRPETSRYGTKEDISYLATGFSWAG